MEDLDYLREALALAKEAREAGEVPVGCGFRFSPAPRWHWGPG